MRQLLVVLAWILPNFSQDYNQETGIYWFDKEVNFLYPTGNVIGHQFFVFDF